jgi:flagellar biosynthesis/type III secretory pathway chaperone
MNQHDTLQELDEVAGALHRVLADEFAALKRMDAEAVERAAACKEILIEKLAALRSKLPDHPAVRSTLGGIQAASQANQALLIHARACLRGAIELAAGASLEPAAYSRTPGSGPAPALRVDIRG